MSLARAGPIPGSYWVEPGRLLAGPYPDPPAATVDLTEGDEGWVDYWSARPELEHHRTGLVDFAPPAEDGMRRALTLIDTLLARRDRAGRARDGPALVGERPLARDRRAAGVR